MYAMKRILREPLFHFIVLGAALFAAHGLLSGRERSARIVVTRGRIESLATAFALTWQRPPRAAELEGLIRDYVREEAAVREARRLGLDEDDAIIRRRMRQKLEFISEDVAAQAAPTEAQLAAWLAAHPADFGTDAKVTFSQVFLDPIQRGEHLARDEAQLLARLRRAGAYANIASLGDPFLLGHWFDKLPIREAKMQFGEAFAAALDSLEPGEWRGPIASSYGTHLVFVHERTAGRVPALDEVRDAVRREWSNAQRVTATEALYDKLLERYTVTIEKPEAGASTAGADTAATDTAGTPPAQVHD